MGASWGVSGSPLWLKQGRLGAPRRPKTVLDYFFRPWKFSRSADTTFLAPLSPSRAPPKASRSPLETPLGPQEAPRPPEKPKITAEWTKKTYKIELVRCFFFRRHEDENDTQNITCTLHLGSNNHAKHPQFLWTIGARRLSRSDWDPPTPPILRWGSGV